MEDGRSHRAPLEVDARGSTCCDEAPERETRTALDGGKPGEAARSSGPMMESATCRHPIVDARQSQKSIPRNYKGIDVKNSIVTASHVVKGSNCQTQLLIEESRLVRGGNDFIGV